MKVSNITFYENPPSGSRANTYGQTDMTKLVGAFRGYSKASETQVRISTLHRESERRSSVMSFLMGMYLCNSVSFFAEIKCKQHITLKSRLLSCTRSCSELDDVYGKLDTVGLKAGG